MSNVSSDRVAEFFSEQTPRRLLLVALFVASIWLVKGLMVFFIFFAAFVMLLKSGQALFRHFFPKAGHQLSVLVVVTLEALLLALLTWAFGPTIVAKVLVGLDKLPALWLQVSQSNLFAELNARFPNLEISEWVTGHISKGFSYAKALGHALILCTIAFVVAIVYVNEEKRTLLMKDSLCQVSILGTLARWWGYLYDGVAIMIRTQVLIALANALLTFPILALLGMPQLPTLTILVFLSGLVPVLGNVAMGLILSLIAYSIGGLPSTLLLLSLTAVLHKLESYYINPRFATKYISVTSFVIVISLLVWEQLLGIKGVFVSLPFLYLWQQIGREWQAVKPDSPPSP